MPSHLARFLASCRRGRARGHLPAQRLLDADHFYAFSNRAIGKYRKENGARVAGWEARKEDRILHLNAGIVSGGRLYCAHSNFPEAPAQSSLEIFDAARLTHLERHVFPEAPGSLTWIVPRGTGWSACFAHYRKTSDPAFSRVVQFDSKWAQVYSWKFPQALLERFAGNSSLRWRWRNRLQGGPLSGGRRFASGSGGELPL